MLLIIYFLIIVAPLIALTTWIAQMKHQRESKQGVVLTIQLDNLAENKNAKR